MTGKLTAQQLLHEMSEGLSLYRSGGGVLLGDLWTVDDRTVADAVERGWIQDNDGLFTVTSAGLAELGGPAPTRPKLGNRIVEYDGHTFHSQKERDRYIVLRGQEQRGEISDLRLQPLYVLLEGFRDSDGAWHKPITYKGDFEYREDGALVVEDVKANVQPRKRRDGKRQRYTGMTDVFAIKEKLFRKRYPQIRFRIVRL